MKELYDKLIDAYKSGDEDRFVAAARNWFAAGGDNPFSVNTKEHELYFNAKKSYGIWKSDAINCRISKKRMVAYAKELAALDVPNPYVEKEQAKQPKKVKQTKVLEEPAVVLGVLPEEEPAETVYAPALEEVSKEPDDTKKGFFSKHKKR